MAVLLVPQARRLEPPWARACHRHGGRWVGVGNDLQASVWLLSLAAQG